MSNDVWRWADPEGQQRRVRLDELRAALAGGHIAPNTPVWKPGWTGWQSAHEVPELSSASLGAAHGVVLNIPPPPLAMVAVQQDYEKKSESLAPGPVGLTPSGPEPEPPVPPPRYIPVPTKKMPSTPPASSSQSIATQIGSPSPLFGSASSSVNTAAVPAAPAGQSIPTVFGMPAPRLHGGAPVEELSASALESGSLPDLSHGQQGFGAPPPNSNAPQARQSDPGMRPSDPLLQGGPLFLHDPPLRQPNVLEQLISDIKGLTKGEPPKNTPVLIAAGALTLMMMIGFLAIIISIASGGSASAKTTASASASAVESSKPPPITPTASTAIASVTPPPPVAPPAAKGVLLGDCTVAGEPKVIAPRAVTGAAIEVQALGPNVGLGFAAGTRDAVATMLDPSTLAATSTMRTKPAGDVRRVTPILNNGKLAALADFDKKGDRLSSRRSVTTSPLVDVGVADGQIVWTPHGKDSSAKLFALEGDAPTEALRAIPLADRRGIALTFRRDNAIRIGVARGDGVLEPDGDLSKIEGLSTEKGTLGSPSIASSGDRVVVAWADRASTGDDWSIRWTTVKAHGSAAEATPFTIPAGGLGGNAMSPAVASLGGGRFLLAWTEGPTSGHQVRALSFGADGSPSGSPIVISAPADNAGQPAIAINDDGRGVIAFLSAKGKSTFDLHATAISCPRQP